MIRPHATHMQPFMNMYTYATVPITYIHVLHFLYKYMPAYII